MNPNEPPAAPSQAPQSTPPANSGGVPPTTPPLGSPKPASFKLLIIVVALAVIVGVASYLLV